MNGNSDSRWKFITDGFGQKAALTVLLSLGLLALDRLPRGLPPHSLAARTLGRVVREMHNGELNADDLHVLAAGYYEELRNDVPVAGVFEQGDIRSVPGFLRYELRPNVKRSYAAGMRITNSLGLANQEYGYQKPPHTRRIALLGDSVSLGPYGHDYRALLENRLNRDCLTTEIQGFQVLNFAVYGYSILQMMDVALDKASRFHPDVYVVAETDLEVMGGAGWRTHIARLVQARTDLKYDFLKKVVAQAGVQPSDRQADIQRKLTPWFLPVLRWALEQIRDHAATEGAQMVILLVPTPINPDYIATDFDSLLPAVGKVGVPVVDLRDTFRNAENLRDFEVIPGKDIHPNVKGHETIFENLYSGLRAQPKAWAILAGN
jgi:hypothetical protein